MTDKAGLVLAHRDEWPMVEQFCAGHGRRTLHAGLAKSATYQGPSLHYYWPIRKG